MIACASLVYKFLQCDERPSAQWNADQPDIAMIGKYDVVGGMHFRT
jgi:hypothetical protein